MVVLPSQYLPMSRPLRRRLVVGYDEARKGSAGDSGPVAQFLDSRLREPPGFPLLAALETAASAHPCLAASAPRRSDAAVRPSSPVTTFVLTQLPRPAPYRRRSS